MHTKDQYEQAASALNLAEWYAREPLQIERRDGFTILLLPLSLLKYPELFASLQKQSQIIMGILMLRAGIIPEDEPMPGLRVEYMTGPILSKPSAAMFIPPGSL